MALTPADVHQKEFKTARFGGYNEDEVDAFLDLVAEEITNLNLANNELQQHADALRQKVAGFEEMQSSLQAAILTATQSAEMVRENAKKEADSIISRAKADAEALVTSAQEQSRKINDTAHAERLNLEAGFIKVRDIRRKYIQAVRELAEAQLEEISQREEEQEHLNSEGEEAISAIREIGAAEPAVDPPPGVNTVPLEQEFVIPGNSVQQEVPQEPELQVNVLESPPVEENEVIVSVEEPDSAAAVLETQEQVPTVPTGFTGQPYQQADTPPYEARMPVDTVSTDEQFVPPSSSLIDEVLMTDWNENPYEDDADPQDDKKRRKGRKEKKEKRFFWE